MARSFLTVLGCLFCAAAFTACAGTALSPNPSLNTALTADLQQYLSSRAAAEHISAVSLSVSLHGRASTIDVAAGTTTVGGSTPATPANLFQIGSNTKAFTAVIILQLEAENKLSLNQTVGFWLPQYPGWSNVTIRQLLNMTSGIKTYDDTAAWEADYSSNPTGFMSAAHLVGYIDPSAPLPAGWLYSNTGYELAQLIIEKVTNDTYAGEVQNRIITPLGLQSTFYNADVYPAGVQSQMVAGYFANNDPDNAGLSALLGRDVRPFSASWAQAAGGIVSTPADLTRWVRALYQGTIIAPAQRSELMSLVSQATGAPIAAASAADPHAFGLGVGQTFQPALGGAIWFYEGETLGYRMLYAYVPASDLVLAIGLNSQPPGAEDDIGQLVGSVYQTLQLYNQV